jgi:cytochrome c oxidase assembly protein subunit 15
VIGLLGWRAWRAGWRGTAAALGAAVTIQILLGIATIVTGVQLWIGVAHQAMAAVLLGALLVSAHRLGQRPA